MYVCMYVCMYVYCVCFFLITSCSENNTHTWTHTHTHTHTHIHTFIHKMITYIHTYIHLKSTCSWIIIIPRHSSVTLIFMIRKSFTESNVKMNHLYITFGAILLQVLYPCFFSLLEKMHSHSFYLCEKIVYRRWILVLSICLIMLPVFLFVSVKILRYL